MEGDKEKPQLKEKLQFKEKPEFYEVTGFARLKYMSYWTLVSSIVSISLGLLALSIAFRDLIIVC